MHQEENKSYMGITEIGGPGEASKSPVDGIINSAIEKVAAAAVPDKAANPTEGTAPVSKLL